MVSSGMEIVINATESSRTKVDPPTFPLVSILASKKSRDNWRADDSFQ